MGTVCVPGNSIRTLKLKPCTFVHSSLFGLTDGQIKLVSRIGMKGSRQVTALSSPFVSLSFEIQLIFMAAELNNIKLMSHRLFQ